MSNSHIVAYQNIPEPFLTFSPEDDSCIDIHPLKGLVKYGPYNQKIISKAFNKIRVATIGPIGTKKIILDLINRLKAWHFPKERKQYLIDYPGFQQVFKKDIVISEDINIEISVDQEKELLNSDKPHIKLSEILCSFISKLDRYKFDILFIYLPEKWKIAFENKLDNDFDLHDFIKSVCVGYFIPTQIIRENALNYNCQCSVMWHLGIAIYSKITGVPWKLAQMPRDTAYIGMSYALRNQIGKPNFITCCSQIFDSEGSGLEFVAYETNNFRFSRIDNPYLTREEIRKVMGRCLSVYQERNMGILPKKIVIHKSTEFKEEEISGCYDALKGCDNVELLQIQQNVSWKGIKIDAKNKIANYPCDRGIILQLDNSLLLWTQGNVLLPESGKNFYKEGRGIPEPLLLNRFAGHGSWYESANSILGLSKMNWNSDSLYDKLPVTLEFAQKLARTIKRMPNLEARLYQYRFFM